MKSWRSLFACACLLMVPVLAAASDGHTVTSAAVADASFQVEPALEALPPLRFPIRDQTDVERRLFVESADGVVTRMLVLQFETVQPGSDFRFRFPPRPPRQFGPHVYRAGSYAYDDVAAATREPALEAARTRAALQAQGLRPPRYWHIARLARVSDSAGLHEAIIFYLENADARYPAGLTDVDEDGDGRLQADESERLWQALANALQVQTTAARDDTGG
ncbi:hypothetical protein [Pseudoxanthomonas dokdonensis]|uniref:EF-hand domain-containing protein n=1 Tax=Pseudoxanthomonas dokdonensis TaxID=344882 RepID=A0A0R0CNF6_9GAMM|nr:hypothetical protein [Pseudoxanthomonas dokdonensis]KRG71545.1 hypothetical protein ABB29_01875 [Pseudoxanthomonas dokdonensis]